MAERYPECLTIRVAPNGLVLEESRGGCTVRGRLAAAEGPVREADMEFVASATQLPRAQPYGGTGAPVWGSRFACWGVDLMLDAKVRGRVTGPDLKERFDGTPGVVTQGSFGRIAPLQ